MAKGKQPQKKASAPPAKGGLYTVEVALINGPLTEAFVEKNPVVTRTIQVRGDQTLADLHDAIFDAFDRDDEHMYEFQFGKKPMDHKGPRYTLAGPFAEEMEGDGDVEETTLAALGLKTGQRFFYWFDFGDDWWHQITVKAIEDEVPKGKYPKVTERVGESPPQYPDFDEEDE
jgi:hypothetical protein